MQNKKTGYRKQRHLMIAWTIGLIITLFFSHHEFFGCEIGQYGQLLNGKTIDG